MLNKVWIILTTAAFFASASHAADLYCTEPTPVTSQKPEPSSELKTPPSYLKMNFIPRTQNKVLPFEKTYKEHGKIPDIERSEVLWDTYYSQIAPRLSSDLQASFPQKIPEISLTDDAEYKINVRASGASIQFKNGATELTMYYSLIAYKTMPKDAIWRRMCSTTATKPLPEEDSAVYTAKLAEELVKEISRAVKPMPEETK